jgi:conjugal transfer pilus assembly protein TraW
MLFPISAKDHGIMGETFPVEEVNLLSFLRKSVVDGQSQRKLQRVLVNEARNPRSGQTIESATRSRSFLIDPSFNVATDIEDGSGRVLAKAGSIINPLDKIQLSSGLIFFNGGKNAELAWAKKQPTYFKWILVQGKPIDLEELSGRPVYFDQGGIHAARFQIKNSPARITQRGRFLLIEELALSDEGEEL